MKDEQIVARDRGRTPSRACPNEGVGPGTSTANRPEITCEQAQHFIDTTHAAVTLRLAAGAHPADAMMSGWDLLQAWVAAHVDGSAHHVYGDGSRRVSA